MGKILKLQTMHTLESGDAVRDKAWHGYVVQSSTMWGTCLPCHVTTVAN